MAEPTSSTAAGLAGWKLAGGAAGIAAGGAGLAAVVVMCMTPPRSTREWAVALISTVLGSVCGGAGVVQHFNLHGWTQDYVGLVALMGLAFACGLPAWAVVRWCFNWIDRRRSADIAEVAAEVRRTVAGG
jgi:hypothetical protein